jgi:short-subunit dehydrogenase
MKNVYLTGSTGGIGTAISRRLAGAGYRVIPIRSRLEDTRALTNEVEDLLREHPVNALINAAGFGRFAPHETISHRDIELMVAVNLTAPMILANLCLRCLREIKGHIIHITSVEAVRHARFSALYTATKSGLRHFSWTLFEEVRKSGVRVTSINPGMTRTGFFDNLDFAPAEGKDFSLDPEAVADAVVEALEGSAVVTDMTILPQRESVKRGRPKKGTS